MAKAEQNTQQADNVKFSIEKLMHAFSMLDMAVGRSATDLIIVDLKRRGIMLDDANKSYSLDEIKKALRITFNEDAVTALIDYLKHRL